MIIGEKVRLRAIERDDLPRFAIWFNDPEVRAGMQRVLPLGTDEEEAWFEQMMRADPVERPMAVDALQDGVWVHIGSAGLMRVDALGRHAELGITIGDKTFWNRGFGGDALRTLLRHAFETLNLNRVYLRVYEDNLRAIQTYRRAGFREEGRLRQDRFSRGRYWDTLIMGILRSEWQADARIGG